METVKKKEIRCIDGIYVHVEHFVAEKLKSEEFPSNELKNKYPEDFAYFSSNLPIIGEISHYYSGCLILID